LVGSRIADSSEAPPKLPAPHGIVMILLVLAIAYPVETSAVILGCIAGNLGYDLANRLRYLLKTT